MSNIERYKKYFTKEYLMGPNSFRLLDELICKEGWHSYDRGSGVKGTAAG